MVSIHIKATSSRKMSLSLGKMFGFGKKKNEEENRGVKVSPPSKEGAALTIQSTWRGK